MDTSSPRRASPLLAGVLPRIVGSAVVLGVLLLCGCPALHTGPLVLLPTPPQPPGPRQVIVISDLHWGLGERAPGHFDPYEDARWADEWQRFLTTIDHTGGGATDLILNGDSFELWQSRRGDCENPDPEVGCSEAESLSRFHVVARAHDRELRALGTFASSGNNRVVVIPGNHDAALLFPSVAAAAVKATAATTDRLQIAAAGYWLSADGLIYAEHGHQSGLDAANRFTRWPTPFLDRPDGRYLQRPWGEQFVREFFNRYEDKYPILDNIEPLGDSVRFGLASEQAAGGVQAVQTMLDLLLKNTSAAQGTGLLSPYLKVPRWDVPAIRATGDWLLGPQVLPTGDPLRTAVTKAQQEGTLGRTVTALTDSQIVQLCDQRILVNALRQTLNQSVAATCPTITNLGGAAANLASDSESRLADHITAVRKGLREQRGKTQALQIFIYGHTHQAQAPFLPQRGASPPQVVNTGAWQRITNGAWLESERLRRNLTLPATLRTLQPQDLAPCYTLVRIAPYNAGVMPQPQLLSFQRTTNDWLLQSAACPDS